MKKVDMELNHWKFVSWGMIVQNGYIRIPIPQLYHPFELLGCVIVWRKYIHPALFYSNFH